MWHVACFGLRGLKRIITHQPMVCPWEREGGWGAMVGGQGDQQINIKHLLPISQCTLVQAVLV